MKLLIVDDDEKQIERYSDSINEFNFKNNSRITPVYEMNLKDGLNALSDNYDSAIIDLRLSSTGDHGEGNQIIRAIRRDKRFPICVLTGHPNDLDAEFYDEIKEGSNLFFKLEIRDRPFAEVLQHLLTIHNSGVIEIVGPHGIIEKSLNEIFWSHLSRTLSYWKEQDEVTGDRKLRLLRFVLVNLFQKLEVGMDGKLDSFYSDEMYIVPKLRDEWQTGDIARRKSDNTLFVVVTPACDLAQEKAKSIQVIPVDKLSEGVMVSALVEYKTLFQLPKPDSEDAERDHENKIQDAKDRVLKIANNAYSNRYHFLPPCQTFEGGLLNFQKITSAKFKDFIKDFEKIGSITPSFVKDIVGRFASYYARQGAPSFNDERIFHDLIK